MLKTKKSFSTDIEDEIDAIRDAIHEKTKDMSPAEHIAYIKEKTQPIIEQFNMRVISSVPEAEAAGRQAAAKTIREREAAPHA